VETVLRSEKFYPQTSSLLCIVKSVLYRPSS
jgi:hypothetical protein